MNINIFTFKEIEIEVTYLKGQLTYTFEHDGKRYGNAMKVPSKRVMDIMSATFQLIQNAIETIETLKK